MKELLSKIPDNAYVWAYEGEVCGIVCCSKKNSYWKGAKQWFISASGGDQIDMDTQGFEE